MNDSLAAHYARALADAVFAQDSGLPATDAVTQLAAAEGLINGSKELQRVLYSPAVNRAHKDALINDLGDMLQVHRLIRNFLKILVSHRRTKDLRAMRQEFELVVDERTGWVRARVASAQPLSDSEKEEVERALGTKLGKFIRAHYEVDESLLAGIRANVGTVEYDATLRGKLEGMRQKLSAEL